MTWACSTAPGCCRSYEHFCEKTARRHLWELIVQCVAEKRKAEEDAASAAAAATVAAKTGQQQLFAQLRTFADGIDWPFFGAVALVLFVLALLMFR